METCPLRFFVGYDPRDELAFRACVSSLRAHATIPLEIYPLKEYDLRRKNVFARAYRVESSGQMIDAIDGRPFSTQFSFTRFSIPIICRLPGWAVFCDADFLWRRDIADLVREFDDSKNLMCVQHEYSPPENTKFDGMLQQKYRRKNWSSLMAMQPANFILEKEVLNNASGRYLHQLKWLPESQIGALPETWNWLEGHSTLENPSAVHYTRGTPDMLGDMPYSKEWWDAARAWSPSMNHHEIAPCG